MALGSTMNWFFPIFMFICIGNQLSLIEWYWRIQYSIQMPKCERTINITNIYNYQESNTHPIWFNDNYQIDKSMVCDSLINNRESDWLIAGLIEWWIQLDFLCKSIGFYPFLFHCCYFPVLLHFFYAVIYSYSIRQNQYPISVSMIVLYYLSIDQWIHKCE